jgi:chitinase
MASAAIGMASAENLGTTVAPSVPSNAANSPAFYIDAYFPGYETKLLPIDRIDFAALTRLIVARVTPRPNGSLETTFDTEKGLDFAQRATRAVHSHGRKAILMVGGEGAHAGFIAATTSVEKRRTLIQSLLSVVNAAQFDGIDLDWEPIETADQTPLLALLDELTAKAPALELSVPVGWDLKTDAFYGQLAKRVARINLMTYVMAGAWPGWKVWHSSALRGDGEGTPSSVAHSVKVALESGVPRNKLGVGAGFYGMCWSGPKGPGEALGGSTVKASDGALSFAEIERTYLPLARKTVGAATLFDETARAPSLRFDKPAGPKGCTWISYEDARSIGEKAKFVREEGLAGMIVWTLPQGYLQERERENAAHPLLAAMRKELF